MSALNNIQTYWYDMSFIWNNLQERFYKVLERYIFISIDIIKTLVADNVFDTNQSNMFSGYQANRIA